MKRISTLLFALVLLVCLSSAQTAQPAQTAPAPAAPAAKPAARTDVYHVHFNKAALGQAAALADELKKQNPTAPMPGHFAVLRHQLGDDWDYVVIQHYGTKATIDATPNPTPASRNLSSWHGDTFVSGPAWPDFARALGLTPEGGAAAKTDGSVYVVAVWRAAPGHRDQLEQALADNPPSKVAVTHVLMQHLEGGPWQFLAIDRYNSWQDFATEQGANINAKGWSDVREHSSFHHDTVADRIAPAAAK